MDDKVQFWVLRSGNIIALWFSFIFSLDSKSQKWFPTKNDKQVNRLHASSKLSYDNTNEIYFLSGYRLTKNFGEWLNLLTKYSKKGTHRISQLYQTYLVSNNIRRQTLELENREGYWIATKLRIGQAKRTRNNLCDNSKNTNYLTTTRLEHMLMKYPRFLVQRGRLDLPNSMTRSEKIDR